MAGKYEKNGTVPFKTVRMVSLIIKHCIAVKLLFNSNYLDYTYILYVIDDYLYFLHSAHKLSKSEQIGVWIKIVIWKNECCIHGIEELCEAANWCTSVMLERVSSTYKSYRWIFFFNL
jgi:hypothetical protein